MNIFHQLLRPILRLKYGKKRFPITCSKCGYKGLSRIFPNKKNIIVWITCTKCGHEGAVTLDSKGQMS
ncbi:MAG TPA: hypothetical protein VEP90_18470 [Methylomirabilota bacterium]|nr:hypothetical protein [Methylomirabilota bacterium]